MTPWTPNYGVPFLMISLSLSLTLSPSCRNEAQPSPQRGPAQPRSTQKRNHKMPQNNKTLKSCRYTSLCAVEASTHLSSSCRHSWPEGGHNINKKIKLISRHTSPCAVEASNHPSSSCRHASPGEDATRAPRAGRGGDTHASGPFFRHAWKSGKSVSQSG